MNSFCHQTSPVGFGGTKVFPIETITLLVTIGTYPQQLTWEITFLAVDCFSTYNVIIRRPTLNTWRAVTSMHHLLVKCPIEYRIGEAHGGQMMARECYIAILEMDDHLQLLKHQRIMGHCGVNEGTGRNLPRLLRLNHPASWSISSTSPHPSFLSDRKRSLPKKWTKP